MWVDEDREIDVMSYHSVMVMEYKCRKENKEKLSDMRNRRWTIRWADWDRFIELTENEEWKLGQTGESTGEDVDELNNRLIRKLTDIAEMSIGVVPRWGNRANSTWL